LRCAPAGAVLDTAVLDAAVPSPDIGQIAAAAEEGELETAQDENDLLLIRLEASEMAGGAPLSGPVNRTDDATFFVNVYVEDLRDTPTGVVGGAIDLGWSPDLVTVDSTPTFDDAFGIFQQGDVDNAGDLIDEAGALTTSTDVGAGGEALFFSIEATATTDGTIDFTASEGQGTGTITPANFALVGRATEVEWDEVDFVGASVEIVSEAPLPEVSITSVSQFEGDAGEITQFEFEVTLSNPSAEMVSVQVTTEGDSATEDDDYVGFNQQLTFDPDDPNPTSRTVTVQVNGDDVVEADEQFQVRLSDPVNATLAPDGADVGTGTILDDDGNQGAVSGFVYADTDGNEGFDPPAETGLAGVSVRLVDGDGAEQTAVTDNQGMYEFTDLSGGDYEVIENGPVAFFDGPDQIGTTGGETENDRFFEVPLESTGTSSDNNFGEAGLRPEYFSRRLFLASTPSFGEALAEIIRATQPPTMSLRTVAVDQVFARDGQN